MAASMPRARLSTATGDSLGWSHHSLPLPHQALELAAFEAAVVRLDAPSTTSRRDDRLLASTATDVDGLQDSLHKTVLSPTARMTTDEEGNEVVNAFALWQELGAGAHGTVFMAIENTTQQLRAIKAIPRGRVARIAGLADSMDAQGNGLAVEVAVMKKIQHPHVVRLYECIDDPAVDTVYLVMQYIADGAVATVDPASGTCIPVPLPMLWRISRQLLAALRHVHSRGIVHGDIKPENILVEGDPRCVGTPNASAFGAPPPPPDKVRAFLADFGVSRALFAGSTSGDLPRTGCPALQQVQAGTPAFYAPEMFGASGDGPSQAADVWALGVTLYALVFGSLPFFAPTFGGLRNAIVSAALDFPEPSAWDGDEWRSGTASSVAKTASPMLSASPTPVAHLAVPGGGGEEGSQISLRGACSPRSEHEVFCDLLRRMLDRDPKTRITASEAFRHPAMRRSSMRRTGSISAMSAASAMTGSDASALTKLDADASGLGDSQSPHGIGIRGLLQSPSRRFAAQDSGLSDCTCDGDAGDDSPVIAGGLVAATRATRRAAQGDGRGPGSASEGPEQKQDLPSLAIEDDTGAQSAADAIRAAVTCVAEADPRPRREVPLFDAGRLPAIGRLRVTRSDVHRAVRRVPEADGPLPEAPAPGRTKRKSLIFTSAASGDPAPQPVAAALETRKRRATLRARRIDLLRGDGAAPGGAGTGEAVELPALPPPCCSRRRSHSEDDVGPRSLSPES